MQFVTLQDLTHLAKYCDQRQMTESAAGDKKLQGGHAAGTLYRRAMKPFRALQLDITTSHYPFPFLRRGSSKRNNL